MQRELFYVRDGVLNHGAIDFNIPISSHVDYLHFLWWNADFTSTAKYKVLAKVDNSEIMLQPSLNISHAGLVPRSPTYWRLSLPCTNVTEGHAYLEIHLDLGENLSFQLNRSKQCSGRQVQEVPNVQVSSISSQVVFVYSLVIAFVISLVCGIFAAFMQRRLRSQLMAKNKPNTTQNIDQDDPSPLLPAPHFHHHLPHNPGFSIYDGGMTSDAESRVTDWIQQQYIKAANHQDLNSAPPVEEYRSPEDVAKDIEVDRSRLKMGSLVQEGTFGKLFQGRYKQFDQADQEVDVMIKTVMSWSSSTQSQLLVVEGVKLAGLQHKNILSPCAMTWDGTSPMFIYPYAINGNLKQYLSKFTQAGLSTHHIVNYGIQILAAMGHLHKRKLLHKDISARNCFLMTDSQSLKLCDSALSRDLFPSDYHCLGDNNNRPIKWMPLEAIAHNKYSKASDVVSRSKFSRNFRTNVTSLFFQWSYGVFMWELMTKAQQPFSEVDPFEIEDYLNGGYRLHQPMNCPDQLYSVLVSCWGSQPQERASVHQLHQTLQELQKQLQQFV